jgi:hypothetical protein
MSIENFVTFSVEGKIAHVKTISINGDVIDEFDLKAQ